MRKMPKFKTEYLHTAGQEIYEVYEKERKSEMKKLFISVPMKGRTEEQIRESMRRMHKVEEAVLYEELEVIDSYEVDVANLLLHAPKADSVLVARCCDCNNRNDDEKCPLCHVEYKTMFDYKTDDNGFCHKWERRTDDE